MNKNLKRNILLVTIIISIAIVFVPIYFFVLADENDDGKFVVSNKRITGVVDGTPGFDFEESANPSENAGIDISDNNGIVRTFDSITYEVGYTIAEREPTSSDLTGRSIFVEVLIPKTYETVLRYGDSVSISLNENTPSSIESVGNAYYGSVNIENTDYYYAGFNVLISGDAALNAETNFEFTLEKINSEDLSNYHSIKPLIFIKESTDNNVRSIADINALPQNSADRVLPGDITCEKRVSQIDPITSEVTETTSGQCAVEITGKEDYFLNMYLGNRKAASPESPEKSRILPVGLLLGLRNQVIEKNGETRVKGIKGLIIPKTVALNISNNSNKLSFNENSYAPYRTYQTTDDYKIEINGTEMGAISNGEIISGSINNNTLSITIDNIKDYVVSEYIANGNVDFYYFSTNYFLTTLAERGEYDYSDISATLTTNKNNINGVTSSLNIVDTYEYVLGNYLSNIEIYESSKSSGTANNALPYGLANLNYGSDFTLRTSFDFSNTQASGLYALTNYIKIDNDAFKLTNDNSGTYPNSYVFRSNEVGSVPSIKLATETMGENTNDRVLFGFGEWTLDYFEATNAAGCPNLASLTKEQLMNLYGGPCIEAKNTVQWAYSPVATNDIHGQEITSQKGPLIVESTYVSYNTSYIDPGSGGILELYGVVVDNYEIAGSTHQIVTSAMAYGKDANDIRYFGYDQYSGTTLASNENSFVKTSYNFENNQLVGLNSNICSASEGRCTVAGNTALISGIKVTQPIITTHKATDLTREENSFYYYPLAIQVNSQASKADDSNLTFNSIFVDVYLPSYMNVIDNFGVSNEKVPTSIENTTLSTIRSRLNKEAPETDVEYKVYHYILTQGTEGLSDSEKADLITGKLSDFTIYSDIDLIITPNASRPEIYAVVDFQATRYWTDGNNQPRSKEFKSIISESERSRLKNDVVLYNASPVTTKASTTPSNIEKNGSYTFNMLAYNHSGSITTTDPETGEAVQGYTYPNTSLYYVLPYDGDMSSSDISSKIGKTKYKVNFTSESYDSIANKLDYDFYYMKSGENPSNIITNEIKTTSEPSTNWVAWADPTTPVSDVIAIKIVKKTPFDINTYFGSSTGLVVNVETVGSSDGNLFYNSFHILAEKPSNFSCDVNEEDSDIDAGYCTNAKTTKANYVSSISKTSVYERTISGFVFEDYDYNGIYTSDESKLKDIPVSLYKMGDVPENYDPINPSTFVKENDVLVGTTITGENGNYYFGGLSSGNYYVSYTIDDEKYIVADVGKTDDNIPDSENNNSSASLVPNTNKAVSQILVLPEDITVGKLSINNINLGLAVKKEMAISLNKYITEVSVTKNGKTDVYDYSNENKTQVTINVLNPKDTTIRVKYSFSIGNTKYYPGYIGLIIDSMPESMTFNPDLIENQNWMMYDGLLYYNGLSGKLLLPNEKQYFTLVLDLELKQAGTYRNVVSARDLVLMGEELPVYDFSNLSSSNNITFKNDKKVSTKVTPVETETPSNPTTELTVFNTGSIVNAKMKQLSGTANAQAKTKNTAITAIKKATNEPAETNKTENNIVSTSDSTNPIYMWYSKGTIYWWSESDKVYLNSDSSYLFNNLTSVENIETKKFDTSLVTNMESMFGKCSSLTTVDLSKFNTSNVTNLQKLFIDCTNLTNINLSAFDTSHVTSMKSLFSGCKNLTILTLGTFNTSSVTDMSHMFEKMESTTSLRLSGFNTSNVTDMSYMFYGCKKVKTFDISVFDTSNVTNMSNMFREMSSLTTMNLSNFNTSNVTNMENMFSTCSELTTIYTGDNFVTTNVDTSTGMFNNDNKLKGGAGTTYSSSIQDATRAIIDGGTSNPGYFTRKGGE